MDVDATFNHIGQFGREQQKYTMMLSVLRMSQAANLYSFAFVGKEMKFTCLGRDG